jgi:hypothetical protein
MRYHVCVGGKIDTKSRPNDTDGRVVPGLHAAGELVGGISYVMSWRSRPYGSAVSGKIAGISAGRRARSFDKRRCIDGGRRSDPFDPASQAAARRELNGQTYQALGTEIRHWVAQDASYWKFCHKQVRAAGATINSRRGGIGAREHATLAARKGGAIVRGAPSGCQIALVSFLTFTPGGSS